MDLKHVEAAAEALVQDVVATVRAHPDYANIVNKLTQDALVALAHGAGL